MTNYVASKVESWIPQQPALNEMPAHISSLEMMKLICELEKQASTTRKHLTRSFDVDSSGMTLSLIVRQPRMIGDVACNRLQCSLDS